MFCSVCDLPMDVLSGPSGVEADWLQKGGVCVSVSGVETLTARASPFEESAGHQDWHPVHRKCWEEVQSTSLGPQSSQDLFRRVHELFYRNPGPWRHFQGPGLGFAWSQALRVGLATILRDGKAFDRFLRLRLWAGSREALFAFIAKEGVWHPAGSWRALNALCDRCDGDTAHTGCYFKDTMDVCGPCAAEATTATAGTLLSRLYDTTCCIS